ncbi:hypothetical protein, partial [Streptomyces sp. sk2.1]|uniref:hypothetical protein n=1 Tax=Streptomyces sp. sk2.1 TaxID=2478959 RepID=UPI0037DD4952
APPPVMRSRYGATNTAPPTHSSPNSSASGTLGANSAVPRTPSDSRPAPAGGSRRRAAFVWTGTLLAALLVGGGATAGVLFLMDR